MDDGLGEDTTLWRPGGDAVFDVAALQIQGAREDQEDSVLLERLPGALLVAVADGLGSPPRGEEASLIAVQALRGTLLQAVQDGAPATPFAWSTALHQALLAADERVVELGRSAPSPRTPATTLTAAIFLDFDSALVFASAGDSHLYVARPGSHLRRVNRIHGDGKNRVTSWLGGGLTAVDGVHDVRLVRRGDAFVLASDGLNCLSANQIQGLVGEADCAQSAAQGLIRTVEAKRDPEQDNCSVVVVRTRR